MHFSKAMRMIESDDDEDKFFYGVSVMTEQGQISGFEGMQKEVDVE